MVKLDSNSWLHKVRDIEIDYAKKLLKNFIKIDNTQKLSILEIGSGDGYIIDKLSKEYENFDFVGLEVETSSYENKSRKVFQYDGKNLDFLKKDFDVIFSFHVIEHINDLDHHSAQIKKLLKPNGLWINVVPSNTWRIFTTINYYPAIFFNLLDLFNKYKKIKKGKKSKFSKNIFNYLIPQRHGENGNFITEFYYFSISYWSRRFRELCNFNNMILIHVSHIPYFYYSRDFFRNLLNDKIRFKLSKLFGGSSIILISRNHLIKK